MGKVDSDFWEILKGDRFIKVGFGEVFLWRFYIIIDYRDVRYGSNDRFCIGNMRIRLGFHKA